MQGFSLNPSSLCSELSARRKMNVPGQQKKRLKACQKHARNINSTRGLPWSVGISEGRGNKHCLTNDCWEDIIMSWCVTIGMNQSLCLLYLGGIEDTGLLHLVLKFRQSTISQWARLPIVWPFIQWVQVTFILQQFQDWPSKSACHWLYHFLLMPNCSS